MEGESILKRPPHRIAEIGIGRTFQNVALFPNLSVLDNVRVGTHARTNSDIISDSLRLAWVRRGEAELNKRVHEIVSYLDLDDVAHVTVSGLPFGTQKRVELARALAADPKILLLDEPAGGLNHEEVHVLGDLIRRIRDERNDDRAAGRASHGPRDVDRRPRRGAEFRPQARRGHAGRRCRPTPTSSRPISGSKDQ